MKLPRYKSEDILVFFVTAAAIAIIIVRISLLRRSLGDDKEWQLTTELINKHRQINDDLNEYKMKVEAGVLSYPERKIIYDKIQKEMDQFQVDLRHFKDSINSLNHE